MGNVKNSGKILSVFILVLFAAFLLLNVTPKAKATNVGAHKTYASGSVKIILKDTTSGVTTTGTITLSKSKAPSFTTMKDKQSTWNCKLTISGANNHGLKLNQTQIKTKPNISGDWTILNIGMTYTQHAFYQYASADLQKANPGARFNFMTYNQSNDAALSIGKGVVDTNTVVKTLNFQVNGSQAGLITSDKIRYTGSCGVLNFKRPAYTVTFMNGTGGTLKTQSVLRGASATAPANPTRNGYVFAGWDKGYSNIKANTIVTAKWTPIYTVTFTNGYGGVITTQSVIKGNSATAPATPTRTGYDFAGWDRSYTNVTGNITVNATWTPKKTTYAFNGNGGIGSMSNLVVSYGGSGTLPSNAFTRKGYVFQGWSTSKRGNVTYRNGAQVTNQTNSNTTITLYAVWKKGNTSFSTIRVTEDENIFTQDEKIIGGNGTTYDAGQTDSEYARTDTNEYPGYFSKK